MTYDTNNRLKHGLIKALTLKPLYELKDLDVINCAEVAPATFYKYYANRKEILDDVEESLIADFKKAVSEDLKVWYELKHSPSKKDVDRLLRDNITSTLDFFAKNSEDIVILVSNNGDPLLRNKMVEILSTRLSHLFIYYFKIYQQEKMLQSKPVLFHFLSYREANDIVNTLIYWVRYKDQITINDAREYLLLTLTKSAYEITAHGFN